MTPRLVFRPQAFSELLETQAWYENQRPGLGYTFAEAIDSVLTGIARNPRAYPRVQRETRRALVPHFPYGVFFSIVNDELVVLAVMHGRRHPRRWKTRR